MSTIAGATSWLSFFGSLADTMGIDLPEWVLRVAAGAVWNLLALSAGLL
jgi:hypothetical protein